VGVDNGFCRADSIKGTAGGRGGKQAGAREGKRKLSICRGTMGPPVLLSGWEDDEMVQPGTLEPLGSKREEVI